MKYLRHLLQRAASILVVSNRELSEEEVTYLNEWQLNQLYSVVISVVGIGSLILPVSSVLVYFMSPQPHHDVQFATHVLVSMIFLTGLFFRLKLRRYVRILVLATELIFSAGYALAMHRSFSDHPDFNAISFLSSLYIAIVIFTIQLCPYPNGIVVLMAAAEVTMGAAAWGASRNLQPFDWAVITSGIASFAVLLFYARTYRTRNEALGELATRKLLVQAERSRVEVVEKQLLLASEIQDSFSGTDSLTLEGGMRVSFYQSKNDSLGGDWGAIRQFGNGESAVVVADATGKGIQAALVIHAIQTLWANSLEDPNFDPVTWLASANRTLIALGRRKDHTMSVGLMVMSVDGIRYFSAGHLPLFLVCGVGAEQTVVPVVARGSLLGLMEDLILSPQDIDLRGMNVQAVLLGTDGVFDRGVRTRKQFVVSLASELEANGALALERCPAADDKLVVLVKKAA